VSADVVVIGAGIVGCACAYYLAQTGLKVRLLERGASGAGASRAGMTHIVTWEEPEIHLKLAAASKRLYAELSQSLPADIQYRPTGSIAVVESEAGMEVFSASVGRLQAQGVAASLLSRENLREREPNLSPSVAGGAYFANDAQVNPLLATLALAQAAKALGATIEPFTAVTGFEFTPGDERLAAVLTAAERIPAHSAVIAAGPWSGEVGRLAGLDIPIRPRKGTLVVTAPVPDDFMNCKIVLAAGYMDSVRGGAGGVGVAANIQQARNGNLLLGSSRQFAGFDNEIDPRVVAAILARCVAIFPQLGAVQAIRTWAGFRPYSPDGVPIISPVEAHAGLYIAAGHEGIGITEGPISGKLIQELICGQAPSVPVDGLAFGRFEQAPAGKESKV
jgi:glycine/D-amino acid oxidase-like deaminating enzyme